MKKTYHILSGIIALTFIIALGAGPLLSQEENEYDESFDPLKLKEPTSTLFNEQTQNEVSRQVSVDTLGAIQDQQTDGEQFGYRVQLLLTPNYQEADSILTQVREMFEGEAQAYWVYDSPNYKIQIGDCTTRTEAEELRDQAQDLGFRFSWVVPSVIRPGNNEQTLSNGRETFQD